MLTWLRIWSAAGRYEARFQIRLMHLSRRCGPQPCGCKTVIDALRRLG